MKARILLVCCIVAIAGASRADDRDRQSIRSVLDAQVAAWNRGDIDGFMQGYWKSE